MQKLASRLEPTDLPPIVIKLVSVRASARELMIRLYVDRDVSIY